MKTISLQVRVPEKLRKDADEVLEKVGLDMSTAVRVYLKKIITTRGIPFSLVAEDSNGLEFVRVDKDIQNKLDKIDSAWKKIKTSKK